MCGLQDNTVHPRLGIGRVALRVNDLERVAAFYEDVIGLERIGEQGVLGAGGEELLVLEQDDAAERGRDEAGLFHVAYRVPDRAALGDVLNRVEAEDVFGGAADHGVSEAIYLSDPEGNGIEVYHDREQAAWKEEDGQVVMVTEPLDREAVTAAASGAETVPGGTTIGHIHLEVTDIEAARRFYVETLGLRVRQDMGSALFLALDDYHHHIGLNTWNRRSSPVMGRGISWFELVVPGRQAALRERCEDAGHRIEEAGNGFVVEDSDGIQLRIVG